MHIHCYKIYIFVQLQGITLTNFDWSSCKNLDQNTKFVIQGHVCQNAVCYSVHVLNNGYQSFDTKCGFSEWMHSDIIVHILLQYH